MILLPALCRTLDYRDWTACMGFTNLNCACVVVPSGWGRGVWVRVGGYIVGGDRG